MARPKIYQNRVRMDILLEESTRDLIRKLSPKSFNAWVNEAINARLIDMGLIDPPKDTRKIWRIAKEAANDKRIREYGRGSEVVTPEMKEAAAGGTYEQAEDLIERCRNHDMQ